MPSDLLKDYRRKSTIDAGELYFWTATINGWKHLLEEDSYKQVIVDSLAYLSAARTIEVYAFVIMPNHLHLIWRTLAPNGKESPQGSFLKYTAHQFRHLLRKTSKAALAAYAVTAANKSHEFWQRDSLAIPLFSREVALQKLTYLHHNPLAERWRLAAHPAGYRFSSAAFYEGGESEFSFLKHISDVL